MPRAKPLPDDRPPPPETEPASELSAAVPWLALGVGLQVLLAVLLLTAPAAVTGHRPGARWALAASALWQLGISAGFAPGLLHGRPGAWAAITGMVVVRAAGWTVEVAASLLAVGRAGLSPNEVAFYFAGILLTAAVPALLTGLFGAALLRNRDLFRIPGEPAAELLRHGGWSLLVTAALEALRLWLSLGAR